MSRTRSLFGFTSLCLLTFTVGCGSNPRPTITVDGSSTVGPVSAAVAEDFFNANPGIEVSVSMSGTGGGMKKFHAGEIDICDASREMKEAEAKKCAEAGIEHIRLSVAYDGLSVVVNPENDWCDSLTVEQLKKIWQPEDPASKWSDLNPDWPDKEIVLFGPGTDSGTFDYFTEEIVGEAKKSRTDFSRSENDNTLVTGVAGNKFALGYFGYAYYAENTDKLKLLGVDSGDGAVQPSMDTVLDGSYAPLSRPLYIYISKKSLERSEMKDFIRFYLEKSAKISEDLGYVPVPEEVAQENQSKLDEVLSTPADAA